MLADGRLHVSGVVLLSRHLTSENAGELLAAAAQQQRELDRSLQALERLALGPWARRV